MVHIHSPTTKVSGAGCVVRTAMAQDPAVALLNFPAQYFTEVGAELGHVYTSVQCKTSQAHNAFLGFTSVEDPNPKGQRFWQTGLFISFATGNFLANGQERHCSELVLIAEANAKITGVKQVLKVDDSFTLRISRLGAVHVKVNGDKWIYLDRFGANKAWPILILEDKCKYELVQLNPQQVQGNICVILIKWVSLFMYIDVSGC